MHCLGIDQTQNRFSHTQSHKYGLWRRWANGLLVSCICSSTTDNAFFFLLFLDWTTAKGFCFFSFPSWQLVTKNHSTPERKSCCLENRCDPTTLVLLLLWISHDLDFWTNSVNAVECCERIPTTPSLPTWHQHKHWIQCGPIGGWRASSRNPTEPISFSSEENQTIPNGQWWLQVQCCCENQWTLCQNCLEGGGTHNDMCNTTPNAQLHWGVFDLRFSSMLWDWIELRGTMLSW